MKNILSILVFSIITSLCYTQTTYRLPDSLKTSKYNSLIGDNISMKLFLVEMYLDQNNQQIKNKHFHFLKDPNLESIFTNSTPSQIEFAKKVICISCYESEWNSQRFYLEAQLEKDKKSEDSLAQVLIEQRKKYEQNKESISKNQSQDSIKPVSQVDNTKNYKPYDLLALNLVRKENFTTVPFIGLDYTYSGINFSVYLQSEMSLTSAKFEVLPTCLKEKFVSGYGTDNLTVSYFVTKRKDIVGYSETSSGDVAIISSVEIVGSYNLILNLYVNYWSTNYRVADYKKGDVLENNYWGDLITLSWVSPTQLKIKITKGLEMYYEKNFGIHKKRS